MDTNETDVQDEGQPLHRQLRKKCHGNRKDQRFRKKCRVRGMRPEKIEKLLEKRKNISRRSNQINGHLGNATGAETDPIVPNMTLIIEPNARLSAMVTTAPLNSHKRKRKEISQTGTNPALPKSISSISIAQPAPKKTKATLNRMPLVAMNDGQVNKNYRFVLL